MTKRMHRVTAGGFPPADAAHPISLHLPLTDAEALDLYASLGWHQDNLAHALRGLPANATDAISDTTAELAVVKRIRDRIRSLITVPVS